MACNNQKHPFRLDPADNLIRERHRTRHGSQILILITLIMCVVCGILLILPSRGAVRKPSAQSQKKEMLLSRSASEISRAEFSVEGECYELVRYGQEWRLEDRNDFSLDQRAITMMIAQCTSVSGTGISRDSHVESDYGFEHPGKKLTLTYVDGSQMTLIVGNLSPVGGYYAHVTGQDQIALVPESVIATIFRGLNALHTVETPVLNEPLSPTLIRIEKVENGQIVPVVEIQKIENSVLSGSGYQITVPFQYEADAEQTAALIENLQQIKAVGYQGKLEEDPQKAADGFRVTMQDRTEMSISFFLTTGASEDTARLFVDDARDIYTVDPEKVRFLTLLKPAGLADRFVALIALDRVESLEIRGTEEKWRLEMLGDECRINGKSVDKNTFRLFYQELCELTVDDATEADTLDYNQEVWSFIYQIKGRSDPYRLTLYDLDRDYFQINRDGNSLMRISKSKVNAVIQKLRELD